MKNKGMDEGKGIFPQPNQYSKTLQEAVIKTYDQENRVEDFYPSSILLQYQEEKK
jgi:hypothetical protein